MKCEKCNIRFHKKNQQGGYFENKWFCDLHINDQPERSKREDEYFVIKGTKECIVLDAIPSEECKEYHRNSFIQYNFIDKTILKRCSEHSGNIVREVQ